MTLLALTLALTTPYLLLSIAGRLAPTLRLGRAHRAKVGLSVLLLITASGHFVEPAGMARMLPPWFPSRVAVIYGTGVLELFGAAAIWVPRLERLAGAALVAMLLGFLPVNVYAAFNHVPFGGHEGGPPYLLVRVPFQLLLVGWAYLATGQRWLGTRFPSFGRDAGVG